MTERVYRPRDLARRTLRRATSPSAETQERVAWLRDLSTTFGPAAVAEWHDGPPRGWDLAAWRRRRRAAKASVRLGEMSKALPKAAGRPTANSSESPKNLPKSEVLAESGLTVQDAHECEVLAELKADAPLPIDGGATYKQRLATKEHASTCK